MHTAAKGDSEKSSAAQESRVRPARSPAHRSGSPRAHSRTKRRRLRQKNGNRDCTHLCQCGEAEKQEDAHECARANAVEKIGKNYSVGGNTANARTPTARRTPALPEPNTHTRGRIRVAFTRGPAYRTEHAAEGRKHQARGAAVLFRVVRTALKRAFFSNRGRRSRAQNATNTERRACEI